MNFLQFLKFRTFDFVCVNVMWTLKVDSSSEFLLQQLLVFHYIIPLDASLNSSTGSGQNCNFVFLAFFSVVLCHLVFAVASRITLIPHQIFAAVSLNGMKLLTYPGHVENWLDFGHHRLIFLILAEFLLCGTGQILDFRAFSWEHRGGIASNLTC